MGANTSEFENEDGSWDYEQLIGGLNAGFGGVDISADTKMDIFSAGLVVLEMISKTRFISNSVGEDEALRVLGSDGLEAAQLCHRFQHVALARWAPLRLSIQSY